MSGPGGTGKTHCVFALQMLMTCYRCQHLLHFVVPTGSAAAIIDGSTIHKAFGIHVQNKEKGKHSQKLGSHCEDFAALISVKNRTQLQQDWKDVGFILIDECSLLSQQILCEMDHALRYAKEIYDVPFGGIHCIISGDFYQYPPVGGTALYIPISSSKTVSNKEIMKRLGRLAWKSLNAVMIFSEQEHMKDDFQYAEAVRRLQI